jgi:hypothetical protein
MLSTVWKPLEMAVAEAPVCLSNGDGRARAGAMAAQTASPGAARERERDVVEF